MTTLDYDLRLCRSPLKWIGGKHTHLRHLLPLLDCGADDYVEPFLGGGTVALAAAAHLRPRRLRLADADPAVVAFHQQVQQGPRELIRLILGDAGLASEQTFVRQTRVLDEFYSDHSTHPRLAAAFALWYTLRWSFDSNRRTFSVGSAPGNRAVAERVLVASRLLRRAEIVCQSFERTLAEPGLVYLDPPYLLTLGYGPQPLYRHEMTLEQHHTLAALLNARPAPWVLSYDFDERVVGLYDRPPNRVEVVMVCQRMVGDGTGPKRVRELVVSRL